MASLMDSNPWPKSRTVLPTYYNCDVCDCTMMYRDHKVHIRGKRHKLKEDALKKASGEGEDTEEAYGGYTNAIKDAGTGAAGGEGCFNCGERKSPWI